MSKVLTELLLVIFQSKDFVQMLHINYMLEVGLVLMKQSKDIFRY